MNDYKEYQDYKEPNIGKFLLFILSITIVVCIVVSLMSCGVDRKIAKAYKNVAVYDAQTTKDSANFYSRAKKMINTPATVVVKEGKTIRVPYPVEKIKKVIDPIALQNITDSLEIAHAEDLNNTVDDCMASVLKARKEGVKTGYERANYEQYIMGRDSLTPEIHYVPDPSTILALDDCEQKLRISQTTTIKNTSERDIYKKQSGKKNIWIIILAVALGISGFINIKKMF